MHSTGSFPYFSLINFDGIGDALEELAARLEGVRLKGDPSVSLLGQRVVVGVACKTQIQDIAN